MPDTKLDFSPTKSSVISYRDLIRFALDELVVHMRKEDYTRDLVSLPAQALSERKELGISHAVAENLMISLSFYLMNTEMTFHREQNKTYGPIHGMILPRCFEDRIEEILPKIEFVLNKNEWLSKSIDSYLKSR